MRVDTLVAGCCCSVGRSRHMSVCVCLGVFPVCQGCVVVCRQRGFACAWWAPLYASATSLVSRSGTHLTRPHSNSTQSPPTHPLWVPPTLLLLPRVQPVHPAFHTAAHIFPVGYIATCTFPSSLVAGSTTRYTTTIAEGQGGAALFVVVTADAPGKQWVATTAAGARGPAAATVAVPCVCASACTGLCV